MLMLVTVMMSVTKYHDFDDPCRDETDDLATEQFPQELTVSFHSDNPSPDLPPMSVHLQVYPFSPSSSPVSLNHVLPSSLIPDSFRGSSPSSGRLIPQSLAFAIPVSSRQPPAGGAALGTRRRDKYVQHFARFHKGFSQTGKVLTERDKLSKHSSSPQEPCQNREWSGRKQTA